jgi:hypothetical protein
VGTPRVFRQGRHLNHGPRLPEGESPVTGSLGVDRQRHDVHCTTPSGPWSTAREGNRGPSNGHTYIQQGSTHGPSDLYLPWHTLHCQQFPALSPTFQALHACTNFLRFDGANRTLRQLRHLLDHLRTNQRANHFLFARNLKHIPDAKSSHIYALLTLRASFLQSHETDYLSGRASCTSTSGRRGGF